MSTEDHILAARVLEQCSWLDGHGADLRPLLLSHARYRRLAAGQWAHGEGDDESGIVVVLRGGLQLYAQAPGDRNVLILQIGPGDAIGQTVRFGGGPRLVTAISTEDTLLLQATDSALGRMAQQEPLVWRMHASLNYLHLRVTLQLLAEAVALPPRQRLAARILHMASDRGRPPELPLSQQALGEMTGLSRKTVNQYLAGFEADGLVAVGYGVIRLLDPNGLSAVASEPTGR